MAGTKVITNYCNAEDVQRLLGLVRFNADTFPTREQVQELILEAEDEIDQTTHNTWKSTTVTEEYYDFPVEHGYSGHGRVFPWGTGWAIYIHRRNITPFSNSDGDKIELWNGSSYDDWVVTKTEGRNNDYWLDSTQGILYIKNWYPFFRRKGIRLTYRAQQSPVPKDIQKATSILASIDIIRSDDNSAVLTDTGDPDSMSHLDRITNLQERYDRIMNNRSEIITL